MASDRGSNPPPPIPGAKAAGRTSPVLVPQGSLEGQPEIPLNRPVTTVGSAESSRLHLLSRTVSKAHAIFVNSGGGTYVADLASRTGTLVNGKMVRDAELKNGDRVQIGKFVFRYRVPANLSAAIQPVEAPRAAVIVVGWPALPIPGRAVSIGREQRADIALSDDAAVSASHAVVFQVDDKWVLRDMGSRTGTLVNGKKIHQQVLNFGDRVTIGSSSILFQPGVRVEDEVQAFDAPPDEAAFETSVESSSLEEITPQGGFAEDEIAIAEEPSSAVDWKAAFPVSASDSESIPLEDEPQSPIVEWNAAPAVELPSEEVLAESDEIPLADESPTETIEVAALANDLASESLPVEPSAAATAPEIDWNFSTEEASEIDATAGESDSEPAPVESAIPAAVEPITDTTNWDGIADDDLAEEITAAQVVAAEPFEDTPAAFVENAIPLEDESATPVEDKTIDWNEIAAADPSNEEVPDVEISAVDASLPAQVPSTETAEVATPLVEDSTDSDLGSDAATFEPEMVLATESPRQTTDWNATVATDLPDIEADESWLNQVVEPSALVDVPADKNNQAVSEIETPASITEEPTEHISEEDLLDVESIAAEPIASTDLSELPLNDESAAWAATVSLDIASVEIPLAEAPPIEVVEPAAETPPVPVIDPSTLLEEFVFVPADAPVDSNAVPDVLFWGDPESDAVAEQPVAPPVAQTSPSDKVQLTSVDAAFDAAIEASFAETEPKAPAPEQFLEEEEIALPDDLAAFSKASAATAETYGDASPHIPSEGDVLGLPGPENALADSADKLSEFIDVTAVPEAEVGVFEDLEFLDTEPEISTSDESAIGWTAITEQDEPIGEAQVTTSEAPLTEPEVDADLDFIDFGAQTTDVSTPVAEVPIDEPPAPPADTGGPTHGPSMFGFQFEGGSFLGGMPISLHQPAPSPHVPSTVFDAKQTAPAGLETMAPFPVVEVPIAEKPVVPQPPVEPAAPVRSNRPMTPPRPSLGSPNASAAPTSLTGLVSDARAPWSGPPVIPPTVRGNPSKAPTKIRQRMTTAFAAPGAAPRTAEVFSQMTAPIGVEVFGGKPGNPDQFTVPDSKETAAELAQEAEAAQLPVTPLSPLKKPRKSRLPWLVALFILIPVGVWAAMYLIPPISSRLVSAQLTGSLVFDGLTNLSPIDGVNFRKEQEKRLLFNSEDIRLRAQTILEKENQPSGFIANADDYAKVVDNRYLNWSGNTLQLTYNTNDITSGGAQVNAVLAALAERDRDLDDAKARALAAANNARMAVDETAEKIQSLTDQHRKLTEQAQDTPDLSTVSDSDQDAATLNRRWNEAKTIRQNSEAILAGLRGQDMHKPIDIEADPQVIDLKKRLDPLNEQITRLKGISALSAGTVPAVGTNIPEGATTQPAGEIDPLLAPLQQQADLLNKKLEQRRTELAPDAAMSPAQREVNMAARIENLSVKITALQKIENDAKTAADAATARAAQNHEKLSAASLAGVKANEIYNELTQVGLDHTHAVASQSEEEAVLANCVTVSIIPSGPLMPMSVTDLRRPIASGLSAVSCFILGLMIAGELRRPKLMTPGITPAAAPLVHPPVRVIPWPDQSELMGLESDNEQPPVVGEPDQIFGGV